MTLERWETNKVNLITDPAYSQEKVFSQDTEGGIQERGNLPELRGQT